MEKNQIYWLMLIVGMWLFQGCSDEDTPEPQWQYQPPVPAITDGPSEAQRMCYRLWQKYDLHVYYNLSGDTALRTGIGQTQTSLINYNNPAALPMQAADEATAEKFLQLLSRFFALFPDEVVGKGLHRRQVLVKVNPANTRYLNETMSFYWLNTYAEDIQGIVYYGYLKNNGDTDNKLVSHLADWKWGICYGFLRGLAFSSRKPVLFPPDFGGISKGLYYSENKSGKDVCMKYSFTSSGYLPVFDRTVGKLCGIVHPLGALATSKAPLDDFAAIAVWIMTVPKAERDADLAVYNRLKQKYLLVIDFYQKNYSLDLEELSVQWQKIILE